MIEGRIVMSNPTDEELEAEMEDLVKVVSDRNKGNFDQTMSSLRAMLNSRPDLKKRYSEIAVRKFFNKCFDEIEAEDLRKDGKLN